MGTNNVSTIIQDQELLAERQEKLVDAATTLMSLRGFQRTSVRQIAEATGWTIGALYSYINTKEDILALVSKRVQKELRTAMEAVPEISSPTLRLVAMARAFFAAAGRIGPQAALLNREAYSTPLASRLTGMRLEISIRDTFMATIEEGMKSGEFRPVNARVVAYDFISLAQMWALKHWASEGIVNSEPPLEFDEFARVQIGILMTYLGAPNFEEARTTVAN